jgi:predicted component of type VI protein secretion system
MPTLHVLSSNLNVSPFELTVDRITIGRDPSNGLVLDHTTVSKSHAMLVKNGSGYKLFDVHSTNGTHVNDQRIVVAALHSGDRLRLGDVELCYEVSAAKPSPGLVHQPANSPPPSPPKPRMELAQSSPVRAATTALEAPPVANARPAEKPVNAPRRPVPPPGNGDAKNFDAGTVPLRVTPNRPVVRVIPPAVPAPVQPQERTASELPPTSGKKRLMFAACFALGLLLLFVGYAIQAQSFKFLGLLMATVGFLCLIFDLKFGNLVAPPRRKL